MDIFETVAKEAEKNAQPDNEYMGDDGLLHCSNCGEPVQAHVNFLGKDKVVRVLCSCREKQYKEKEKEFEEKERQRTIDRYRRDCFYSKEFEDYTFANDDAADEKISNAMKRYVENWQQMKAENCGLLLYGDIGTGKSYYAACIANALIYRKIPVLMTSFARIANTLQGMYEGRQEYIDSLNHYSLLILDDLGTERSSDYMLEQVFAVVDARWQAGLPMIVTTNVPVEEIRNQKDLRYKRVYDRIISVCHPVRMVGKSRRKDGVADNYARRNKLLGL